MTKQRLFQYQTRGGALVNFTAQQEEALRRGGQWRAPNYNLISVEWGTPTQSDAEIAKLLLGKYPKMTHVGVLHQDYRPPEYLFGIRNPKLYQPDAVAATFSRAMECASQQFGCDVVTISERDCTHGFHEFAADWRVTLLVV